MRKGYSVVDEDEAWGFVSLYLYRTVCRRKSIIGKYEKISELCVVNYPFLMKCFNETCYFFDGRKKHQIRDHGVIGSLALLSTYGSTAPYLFNSIDLSYSLDINTDELDKDYSTPKLKSGEGIYRLTYLHIKFKDKNSRTVIQPPIYYIPPTGLYGDLVLKEFGEFKRILGENHLTLQEIHVQGIDRFEQYRRIVVKVKTGLEKLVDKKLVDANDVLKIVWIFE